MIADVTQGMTLGLVLRTTVVRESDLIVTLLTAAHGRISALARGARSSRRRFGGALGFGVLSRFQLKPPRGDLWTLESADIEREWPGLAADLAAFSHAGYVLDLVGSLAPADHADPELFELTVDTLEHLATAGASSAGLRGFELATLDATGNRPMLEACVVCGQSNTLHNASFSSARGGVLCAGCATRTQGPMFAISTEVRNYLLHAEQHVDYQDLDARTSALARTTARELLQAFIEHVLGHNLRSVTFARKLNASLKRET